MDKKKLERKKNKQKRSLSARPTRRAVVLDQLPTGEEGGGDDEAELLGGISKKMSFSFPKDIIFKIHDPIRVQGARRAWCCQGSPGPGHLVHVLLHPLLEGRLHRWQRRLPPGLNLLCQVFFAHIVLSSSRPRRSSSSRILSLVSQFSQSVRWPPMAQLGAGESISCSREPWDLSLAGPLVRGSF